MDTENTEKRGIVSLITGLASMAYKGMGAYLKWKKTIATEKGYITIRNIRTPSPDQKIHTPSPYHAETPGPVEIPEARHHSPFKYQNMDIHYQKYNVKKETNMAEVSETSGTLRLYTREA